MPRQEATFWGFLKKMWILRFEPRFKSVNINNIITDFPDSFIDVQKP